MYIRDTKSPLGHHMRGREREKKKDEFAFLQRPEKVFKK